ncbi:MAG TPA: c-type cytochrome, partial [Longimicrobiales bacterium]|nr:c-type cytochrome [Longimicrobiales bacterium]
MKLVKILLGILLVLVLLGAAFYGWAASRARNLLGTTVVTHTVDFPVPFPLPEDERATLAPGEDPDSVALARARERGRHLVESRYGCAECHGADFGGGVMVDDPLIGSLLAPNLTSGEGSAVTDFTPADWERIVRHGVRHDGRPAVMPAQDFRLMSDRELSDIIVYVRGLPPVDRAVSQPRLGPLGTVLLATGQIPLAAFMLPGHDATHAESPPAEEASVEFGRHLAAPCMGCHGPDLAGGPIPGGDPSWPPAANLTSHAEGLGTWGEEDFDATMREGRKPDGTELLEPMARVVGYTRNMTEVELDALWAYLRSVEPVPGN